VQQYPSATHIDFSHSLVVLLIISADLITFFFFKKKKEEIDVGLGKLIEWRYG